MEEKKCPGKNLAEEASIAICIAFLGLSKNLCISEKCLLCAKKVRRCFTIQWVCKKKVENIPIGTDKEFTKVLTP